MRTLWVLLGAWLGLGLAQETREPLRCRQNVDLTLLVDASDSVNKVKDGRRNWDDVKALLNTIIDTMVYTESNVRVALVTFSHVAYVHFDLDDCGTKFCMESRIQSLPEPAGRADYDVGFDACLEEVYRRSGGDRSGNHNIILLITSNEEDENLKESAEKVTDHGIRLTIAGVSENPNHELLRSIVSFPYYENYYAAIDYQQLGNITEHMHMGICPSKFQAEPRQATEVQARCLFDIVVMQDKSGSITDTANYFQNWVDTRFFLVDFMTKFALADPDLVQLAFLTFASQQQLWFHWGDCQTATCVRDAVYKPKAPIGETHMVEAYEYVRDRVLSSSRNRAHAQDLIIFITDGFPNPPRTRELVAITKQIKDKGARIFAIGITKKKKVPTATLR